MRLIDASDLKKKVFHNKNCFGFRDRVLMVIDAQPTFEQQDKVAIVKIRLPVGREKAHQHYCSECDYKNIAYSNKYCPNCGARFTEFSREVTK